MEARSTVRHHLLRLEQSERQRHVPSPRHCGQRLQLRDGQFLGWRTKTPTGQDVERAARPGRHCCPILSVVSEAAKQSGCRIRRVAECLDWGKTDRMSPSRCLDGAPSFPSEHAPPACEPVWLELAREKTIKRDRHSPSENAPTPPASLIADTFPETLSHRLAKLPCQNQPPERSRFHPRALGTRP